MSNFVEISVFAREKGFSVKTLKRRYGDLIRREGRKSFIDPTEYDKAFVDRSRTGLKNSRSITTSTSIPRIQRVIDLTEVTITKMEKNIIHYRDDVKNAQPGRVKKMAEIQLAKQEAQLHEKKSYLQILNERIDELIDLQYRKYVPVNASSKNAK